VSGWSDTIDGGSYGDTVHGDARITSGTVVVAAGGADDTIDGGVGIDAADGGPGTDTCANTENEVDCER
jgi:Ca2+-binding RTX toxin-like protein